MKKRTHEMDRQEKGLRLITACFGAGIVGLFVACLLDVSDVHNRAVLPQSLLEEFPAEVAFTQTEIKVRRPRQVGTKGLVLVTHTHGNGYDDMQEWDNLNYFLRHAVDGSAADYFFVIPTDGHSEGATSNNCWPAHYTNVSFPHVSFVCMPQYPRSCDLCVHSQMLQRLSASMGNYHTVVVLNTGSRGPMKPMSSPGEWIRYVQTYTSRDTAVSLGATASDCGGWLCCASTVFVAIPARAAQRLSRLWSATCSASSVAECSSIGEYPMLEHLFLWKLRVYLTEQDLILGGREDCKLRRNILSPRGQNSNVELRPVNLTRSLFIKFGGGAYRKRFLPLETVEAVKLAHY